MKLHCTVTCFEASTGTYVLENGDWYHTKAGKVSTDELMYAASISPELEVVDGVYYQKEYNNW